MGVTSWKVVEENDVPAGVVTISGERWPTLEVKPGVSVKVTVNGKTKYLSAFSRLASTTGNAIFVQSGTFGITPGTTPTVTVEKVSKAGVRAHLVFKTGYGILSLIGLLLAIGGTVAQAINAVQTTPSIPWIVGGAIAQILGLVLVFFRSVWNGTLATS